MDQEYIIIFDIVLANHASGVFGKNVSSWFRPIQKLQPINLRCKPYEHEYAYLKIEIVKR